eukprot:gene4916-5562_t
MAGPPVEENVVSIMQTGLGHADLSNIGYTTSTPMSIRGDSAEAQSNCQTVAASQYTTSDGTSQQIIEDAPKSVEINLLAQSSAENDNPQISTSPTSPRITIPLSALSSLTSTQNNESSASNNSIIDIQQLQAFLMALQQPAAHSSGAIAASETDIQTTSRFEASNLDSLQSICSSAIGDDISGVLVSSDAIHATIQPQSNTNVLQLQQLASGCLQPVSNEIIHSQLSNPHSTSDGEASSKESTVQAEMIAVEVLAHSVTDDTQANDPALQQQQQQQHSEAITSTQHGEGAPNVINLVQAQVINGSQMYSLQINGQTIPFATIQLPPALSQTDDMTSQQEAPCLQITATDGLAVNPEILTTTAHVNSLNVATGNLQLPCTPVKEVTQAASPGSSIMHSDFSKKSAASDAKEKYTCEICGKVYVRSWSYYGHMREHAAGEKEHRCEICGKTFNYDSNLKQHMLTHTGMKPYKCDLCNKAFNNPSSLRIHALSHSEDKPYVCEVEDCGKSFSNPSSLRVHLRVHQTEKPYKCGHEGCDLAFKTSSELSRHSFRHSGAKPHKCDTCDKSFVRYDDLKRHHFIHTGVKQFKCDQCDFACIQSFDLVKHKYTHGGEKPYKCDHCSKQFTRPARLREHMRQHTGEKPYQCDQCGKAFTQMTSLKSHLLSHSGSKPYKCQLCDKSYTTASDLKSHTNNHTGQRPYRCDICGKDFISAKTLKRHAIVHSGEKPFECGECNRRFARASDLKVHMPVHSDDKPFKCDSCEKMFTRYSTLKEHARTHTGEFPFKCEHCDKIFNHRSHLNVHVRTHTGEKPFKCDMCDREFARKSSLRYHARVHLLGEDAAAQSSGRSRESLSERDYEDAYSPTDSLDDHGVEIEIAHSEDIGSIETISTPVKRKRGNSPEYEVGEQLVSKRMATEAEIMGNASQRLHTAGDVVMSPHDNKLQNESGGLLIADHSSLLLSRINQRQLPISVTASSGIITVDASRFQNSEGQVAKTLLQLPNIDDPTEKLSNINAQAGISIQLANSPARTLILEERSSCGEQSIASSTLTSTLSLTENFGASQNS